MSSALADEPGGAKSGGWLRQSGRGGFPVAMAAYILPYGAPDALPLLIAATAIGLVAAIAALSPARHRAVRHFASEVMIVAALLALYVLFQLLSFEGNPFANPVWLRAENLVGATSRTISVEPSSTYAGLFTLLGPLLAYYSVLQLFDNDAAARRLLKAVALAGCLFGLHGLLQWAAFPEGLILPTRAGTDLTGIFINRNTAGTFLGIGSLASLGWLIEALAAERASTSGTASAARALGRYRWTIVAGTCLAVCILCLFMTRSRGAMLAWFMAFSVVLPLIALNHTELLPRWARRWTPRFRALVIAAAGLAALTLLTEFLGGRIAARLDQEGLDFTRLCLYEGTMRGFRESWLFGTGFGTFPSVFPQYRPADCGGIQFVFFRAHNFYLEALLGLGILAIPFLLYVYGRVGMLLYRGYRGRIRSRYVPIIGIGGIVLVTVHGMMDFSLQVPGMAIYFACFMGAVSVVSLRHRTIAAEARPASSQSVAEADPS